jgi:hypothetical protein
MMTIREREEPAGREEAERLGAAALGRAELRGVGVRRPTRPVEAVVVMQAPLAPQARREAKVAEGKPGVTEEVELAGRRETPATQAMPSTSPMGRS